MGNQNKDLLQNKEVIDEIGRHRWIESEKAGHDIGFEQAAEDWLKRFSSAWIQYHLPQRTEEPKEIKPNTQKVAEAPKKAVRRRASSYYR